MYRKSKGTHWGLFRRRLKASKDVGKRFQNGAVGIQLLRHVLDIVLIYVHAVPAVRLWAHILRALRSEHF